MNMDNFFAQNKEIPLRSVDKSPSQQYHTLKYDFKPASVNSDQPAQLELTSDGQVSIKAPNVAGSTATHTLFRGQRRPHVKECLLILDHRTGEVVLQKLNDNITVKATRTLNGSTSSSSATTVNNVTKPTPTIVTATPTPTTATTATMSRNAFEHNDHSATTSMNLHQTDGPQLSEDSSSSSESDDDSSSSSSSSGSSSSGDSSSSPDDEGFKF